ncbi:hypothetical protein PoB_003678100 [Plakobranchus ocellatus]|uniref:Uncharacterized protein n=1 Tax=Plakobranchus ocellatus TaxID=259542 RepID=A0AAV4AUP7_9GAST|nr:hypothetical protein PoB_003678100 [Plakobranchus ocellatus]
MTYTVIIVLTVYLSSPLTFSDSDTLSFTRPGDKPLRGGQKKLVIKDMGNHINSHSCNSVPYRLALIDSSSISKCHTIAVSQLYNNNIDIIEVTSHHIKIKRTLQTSQQYCIVASIDRQTLAVENTWGGGTINLLDMSGQILRQLSFSEQTRYMVATADKGLLCATVGNKITKIDTATGAVTFDVTVPQIHLLRAFAINLDGSLLVLDSKQSTLHLVSAQGIWIKKLWELPQDFGDTFQKAQLWNVSVDNSVCVCVTEHGALYILDCVH